MRHGLSTLAQEGEQHGCDLVPADGTPWLCLFASDNTAGIVPCFTPPHIYQKRVQWHPSVLLHAEVLSWLLAIKPALSTNISLENVMSLHETTTFRLKRLFHQQNDCSTVIQMLFSALLHGYLQKKTTATALHSVDITLIKHIWSS